MTTITALLALSLLTTPTLALPFDIPFWKTARPFPTATGPAPTGPYRPWSGFDHPFHYGHGHSSSSSSSSSALTAAASDAATGSPFPYPGLPYPTGSGVAYPTGTGIVSPVGTGTAYPTGTGIVSPAGTGAAYPTGTGIVSPAGASTTCPTGTGIVSPVGASTAYPTDTGIIYPAGASAPSGAPTDADSQEPSPPLAPAEYGLLRKRFEGPRKSHRGSLHDQWYWEPYFTRHGPGSAPFSLPDSPSAPTDVVVAASTGLPSGAFPTGWLPSGAFPTAAFPTGAFPTGAFPTRRLPTGYTWPTAIPTLIATDYL